MTSIVKYMLPRSVAFFLQWCTRNGQFMKRPMCIPYNSAADIDCDHMTDIVMPNNDVWDMLLDCDHLCATS